MADTNFYDVVVCGAQFSGLVAGTLLARRGFRVLLIGHDGEPLSIDAGPYTLPRGPALLPSIDSPAVARVFRELNWTQVARRKAPAVTPAFQVAMPGHRFDVSGSDEDVLDEVAREFPSDRAAAAAVLQRLGEISALLEPLLGSEVSLPPDGFWERREIARVENALPAPGGDPFAPLPAGHPLRAAWLAPVLFRSALGPGELGLAGVARAFDLTRRGLHRLEGGEAGLYALLREKLSTYAGEVRDKVTPVEIIQRRGRAAGVRVQPRDETIGCDHVIWAGPVGALADAGGPNASRRLREAASSVRAACYRYSLCLLLKAGAIPEGMGPLLFSIADPAKPLLEENALCITVGEPLGRERERVPMWVECLVPAPAVDGGPGYLGAMHGRVRAHVARILPFFEQHLLALVSPHDGLPPELPLEKAGRPVPNLANSMPVLVSCEGARSLDVGGLPHATGVKGLLLGSQDNLPGLGLEGEFVSGWNLARLIGAAQPRRGFLRREVLLGET